MTAAFTLFKHYPYPATDGAFGPMNERTSAIPALEATRSRLASAQAEGLDCESGPAGG
jgi:hypothetical protein